MKWFLSENGKNLSKLIDVGDNWSYDRYNAWLYPKDDSLINDPLQSRTIAYITLGEVLFVELSAIVLGERCNLSIFDRWYIQRKLKKIMKTVNQENLTNRIEEALKKYEPKE